MHMRHQGAIFGTLPFNTNFTMGIMISHVTVNALAVFSASKAAVAPHITVLWSAEMTPEVVNASLDLHENVSGAFDASTPQQRHLEWAKHGFPILRAAAAQFPGMGGMFAESHCLKEISG